MASIPDQEPEPDPSAPKEDPEGEEPILAETIPATHGRSVKPWLLQDWIALTVAFSLSGLFIGSAWTTWRDWPAVMRQIAEGNAKLHKTEKIVRDPQELKRHMEEQLQSVDEKIAELKKRLSVLQAESAAREADRAVAERDRKLQNDTVETKTSDLERARIKAKGRVDELPEKTDFESFLRNGPGPPPDPWGPNQMREVWLKWRAKKEAYDTARGFIAPATKELEAAKKQFDNLSKSFKTATLACEKIRKSIDAKESELNLKLNDRQAAEHMLNTTLVEADAAAVKNLSEIRRKIRESEATKAVLLLQNIPTILALLLVSISALVRLALLRGRFKPRALIHS